MQIQHFFENFGGELAIGNGQPQIHKVNGLNAVRKLPLEFTKLVYLVLKLLPVVIIIVGGWYPDTKDIINIPLVQDQVH